MKLFKSYNASMFLQMAKFLLASAYIRWLAVQPTGSGNQRAKSAAQRTGITGLGLLLFSTGGGKMTIGAEAG